MGKVIGVYLVVLCIWKQNTLYLSYLGKTIGTFNCISWFHTSKKQNRIGDEAVKIPDVQRKDKTERKSDFIDLFFCGISSAHTDNVAALIDKLAGGVCDLCVLNKDQGKQCGITLWKGNKTK